MNSWNILGWIILGLLAFFVLRTGLLVFYKFIRDWWRYTKSKKIKPEVGQVWEDCEGRPLYVRDIKENYIGLASFNPNWARSGMAWWDDPTAWKCRIREKWLHLVGNWKEPNV